MPLPCRHARLSGWIALGILAISLGVPDSLSAAVATFVPHRAVYGLNLAKPQSGGQSVTSARGKLEFEWKDVCDGWSVSQRTRIIVTNLDGSEVDFGWTLTAWEAKDGLSYRFFIRRLFGTGETEEVQGSARLEGQGKGGEAVFTKPVEKTVTLPPGTLFPTKHSFAVLDAVAEDAVPIWRVVFDGSGDEGLFGINVALAEKLSPEKKATLDNDLLSDKASWRVVVAYFGMAENAAEPEYEQEMRLYANGIVDELVLDYGDFMLDARLVDLKSMPASEC